jgi:hypothetical protein
MPVKKYCCRACGEYETDSLDEFKTHVKLEKFLDEAREECSWMVDDLK